MQWPSKTEVHAKGKMQGRKWKKQQSYVAAMICCFVWICCSTRRVGLSCCDLTCLGTGPGSISQTLVLKLSTSKIGHELKGPRKPFGEGTVHHQKLGSGTRA